MIYTTLVSPEVLAQHLNEWIIVDCRFSLNDTEKGRQDYREAHIPRAVYAHIDEDLSGRIVPGITGRHPLPAYTDLASTFSAWGIGEDVQVVAYDDSGGSMAARLWWLLHFLGHDTAAVLEGGWPEWVRRGYPTRSGDEENTRRIFFPRPQRELIVNAAAVEEIRTNPSYALLDARDPERFRGEVEPIDPVAGHIPGAVSAPYKENLDERGYFRPAEELQIRFRTLVGNTPADRIVCYCGSGVTAAHDVLAIAHAGLGFARLYPGSWSEWITNPDRPVEK